MGPTRAGRLLSAFIAAGPVYDVVGELVPAGLDARLAGRVVDALGPGAARLLRDDPWQLLVVWGATPADADRLARALIPDVRRDDPRRGRALVGYVLARQARDGHTVSPAGLVGDALREFGAGDGAAAVSAALESGAVLELDDDDDDDLIGLARYVEAEDGIAQGIARLAATAEAIGIDRGRRAHGSLDDAQQAAVAAALESGVSVLTGGPGTGKSRTVATLVALAEAAGKSVALAAPTGRAAKRLEELCSSPASTLHRLLGAQPRQSGGEVSFDGGFARNEEWPLDEDVVVVDEASMLDVDLADALLTACRDGTHLVFVGDAAQLPSIGPGRVLGDLIDSGSVPVTELRTLYRQDEGGSIARLARAVREGELPPVDDPTREVVVVPARGSAEAAHRVVQLVTDSIPRALGIAADQVQVVTPVHRGAAGTLALNSALKAKLNPGSGKGRFDVGDRVVATANHLEAEPFGYANGEVGVVDEVERDGTVTVEFASGPAVVKGKALADLVHGWAITVHRAQGSEFPAVVVVVPPEAGGMLSRPLVYTAMTRAQRHLSVVHGAGPLLARAVRQIGTLPRRTRLQVMLREYLDGGGPPSADPS
ncbi:AAA family ATPase [Jatrophihabitans cynanchi]|uniref:AAA family ATPase n=1 Tax=Jatrophihabitans cynanchi TaxID=2944128 RepID=A0ABY7JX31_9ACTN|nr:AAA family ATPase [Jatrophihabitans sp. SB3-54]WAX57128.1 AAA family ATPase [Jatrophihabitans sp. SB3-54]